MKEITLLCFMLLSFLAFGQNEASDIIYLNDGSILKGKIIERLDDGAIKMVMDNGREIIISMREVKQITVEGIGTNPDDYGGKTAFGIALFGDGVVEGHFRLMASKNFFLDLSVQPDFTALLNDVTNETRIEGGIGIGGELDYFIKRRYKETKQKIRANGIYLRGASGFHEYTSTKFHVGWVSEYFRLNRFKRGFQLNLGYGYQINHWYDDPLNAVYREGRKKIQPYIHFRIQWNYFK